MELRERAVSACGERKCGVGFQQPGGELGLTTYLAREDLRSQFTQWNLELPVAPLDADLDTDQGVGRDGGRGCHSVAVAVAVADAEVKLDGRLY